MMTKACGTAFCEADGPARASWRRSEAMEGRLSEPAHINENKSWLSHYRMQTVPRVIAHLQMKYEKTLHREILISDL
jgi:hypothetical protein